MHVSVQNRLQVWIYKPSWIMSFLQAVSSRSLMTVVAVSGPPQWCTIVRPCSPNLHIQPFIIIWMVYKALTEILKWAPMCIMCILSDSATAAILKICSWMRWHHIEQATGLLAIITYGVLHGLHLLMISLIMCEMWIETMKWSKRLRPVV